MTFNESSSFFRLESPNDFAILLEADLTGLFGRKRVVDSTRQTE